MLFRTSSHTCGRWYLPIFLLRDGLLTLMYTASLISLIRLLSSLPTTLKLLIVVSWPVMLLWSKIGEGCFKCSLNLSPKVLADSPIYSSSHSTLSHLYLYMIPLFWVMRSLSFGAIRRSLMVLPPLKKTWMPYFLQVFLTLSPRPLMYGTVMYVLPLGWLLFPISPLFLFLDCLCDMVFFCALFKAHLGYLHVVKACLMWSCSFTRC